MCVRDLFIQGEEVLLPVVPPQQAHSEPWKFLAALTLSYVILCCMSPARWAGGGQEWGGCATPSFDQTCPGPWLPRRQGRCGGGPWGWRDPGPGLESTLNGGKEQHDCPLASSQSSGLWGCSDKPGKSACPDCRSMWKAPSLWSWAWWLWDRVLSITMDSTEALESERPELNSGLLLLCHVSLGKLHPLTLSVLICKMGRV